MKLISFCLVLFLLISSFLSLKEKKYILFKNMLNYTESTEFIDNCDCGCTSTAWITAEPGKDWTTEIDSYTLLLIAIGAYSSNAGGTDRDLDDKFFESFEGTLESARKNGKMVGIRIRYDDKGAPEPEPDSFEQVLKHIDQIGKSGLLSKYSDVISFAETGMVGSWGEQWGGRYTSVEYKARVLDRFLSIVPDPIPVTVRTPDTFVRWLSDFAGVNINGSEMAKEVKAFIEEKTEIAKKAARVGLYNDGYMGSDSDLGTYSNREAETGWLSDAPAYGGEFSYDHEHRMKYTIWHPENAIPEMYKTNLMRINSNIYKTKAVHEDFDSMSEAEKRLDEIYGIYNSTGFNTAGLSPSITVTDDGKYRAGWKWPGYDSFTFSRQLDGQLGVNCDNSAFYGKNCFDFISSHIGYRYVIRSMEIKQRSSGSNLLNICFIVENTGFSEAPSDKEVEIIIKNGEESYIYKTDINARDWKSAERTRCSADILLPENLSENPADENWKVYLRVSNKNDDPEYDNMFCTKFANADIEYNEKLGANLIGRIRISKIFPSG